MKSFDSVCDKVVREAQLLAGATLSLSDGVSNAAEELRNHPERGAYIVADAVVGSAVLTMINKNPAALGKGLQPAYEFFVAHGGKICAGLVSADLLQRIAEPLLDTWRAPDEAGTNKRMLGRRLGAAVVDYALPGGIVFAGAKLGSIFRVSDLIGASHVRPRLAYVDALQINRFAVLSSEANASAKNLIMLNQGNHSNPWREIQLTGKTRVVKPSQAVEGERGDIILHAPESGRKYIGAKLIDDNEPGAIGSLRGFDVRDVLAKAHINFNSQAQREQNLQTIEQVVAKLKGEIVLRRDTRHHRIDSFDDLVQYRLRIPLWLDPTIRAPKIELRLSGRLFDFEPIRPRKGDLYLSRELDMVGADNRARGSGAQSGRFTLNVYDDQLWLQKFNLQDFLSYHTDVKEPGRFYRFFTKYEMVERFPKVVETLQPYIKEELAFWNHNPKKRMFELGRS